METLVDEINHCHNIGRNYSGGRDCGDTFGRQAKFFSTSRHTFRNHLHSCRRVFSSSRDVFPSEKLVFVLFLVGISFMILGKAVSHLSSE